MFSSLSQSLGNSSDRMSEVSSVGFVSLSDSSSHSFVKFSKSVLGGSDSGVSVMFDALKGLLEVFSQSLSGFSSSNDMSSVDLSHVADVFSQVSEVFSAALLTLLQELFDTLLSSDDSLLDSQFPAVGPVFHSVPDTSSGLDDRASLGDLSHSNGDLSMRNSLSDNLQVLS